MTVQTRPPVTGYPAVGNPNGFQSNHPPPAPGAATFLDGAPPPSRPHDCNFKQPDHRAACVNAAKLICSVISFLLPIVLLFTLPIALVLALIPGLPEFRADSLSVPNFNISNNLVAANWDLRFTVRNPNRKVAINYEHIYAGILYGSAPLAQTSVRPFYQGPMNETCSEARFAADGTFVDDWIVERVNREKPYIVFNLKFTAWLSHTYDGSRRSSGTESYGVSVHCENLKVRVDDGHGSFGDLSGGHKQCRVNDFTPYF